MDRRTFVGLFSAALALQSAEVAFSAPVSKPVKIDIAWFRRSRKYADLPMCRTAYVEYGHGPVALFLHGFPLNGYQWRGALERLHPYRRCIAPDFMSLGFTEVPEHETITPATQVDMLAALLDHLQIHAVDLIANDSGGLVAQMFVARYPHRVRTLLLTNCDVDENSPPPPFIPAVELAKKGLFAERFIGAQLNDKELARSERGLGVAYEHPDRLSDETIEFYLRPLLQSPLRKKQLDQYTVALETNELIPLREALRHWQGPARMVWAENDIFFGTQWAEWLDKNLSGSEGIRRLDTARLFFPEEKPDVIAEEAKVLWGIR
jgi:haloalkane dehalogenase